MSESKVLPQPPALETYVDHPGGVALLQVEEHGRLVEVRHHDHVFDLVELGRIHGEYLILLHGQCLRTNQEHQITTRMTARSRNHNNNNNVVFMAPIRLPPTLKKKLNVNFVED